MIFGDTEPYSANEAKRAEPRMFFSNRTLALSTMNTTYKGVRSAGGDDMAAHSEMTPRGLTGNSGNGQKIRHVHKYGPAIRTDRVRTFRKIAPWLLLGPISAFLVAGIYRNARKNEPVLASLYGLALIVAWYDFGEWSGRTIAALNAVIR